MYGPGDFGCVTVLSPDPKSGFSIWETASRLENRECNFIGVVETDSNYYGFLIEHGVCSNDIWIADHDFGYQICDAGYPDFFHFLAKVGSMSGTTRRDSSGRTKGKHSEQPF
jgi:hypothetical protein